MKSTFNLRNEHHDFNIERFKTRLTAKFCVVFISIVQIIIRVIILCTRSDLKNIIKIGYYISFLFLTLTAITVCFEYLLFKKIGPKVMNYSNILDILLLIFFTAEWIVTLVINLTNLAGTNPPSFQPVSAINFATFGWRTLFLLFLIQSWKLLIIPPTLAMLLVVSFAIHYSTLPSIYILLLGLPPVFYTIMMMYFLDKIKWKEVFTNTQQERWMKINQFVLNNIPENIVILELGGEVNFVSEYCQGFMRKSHLSQNPHDLFTNITDLSQQPKSEPSSPSSNVSILYFIDLNAI